MTDDTQSPPSSTEIDGRIAALQAQRNAAFDQGVMLHGAVSVLREQLTESNKALDRLSQMLYEKSEALEHAESELKSIQDRMAAQAAASILGTREPPYGDVQPKPLSELIGEPLSGQVGQSTDQSDTQS